MGKNSGLKKTSLETLYPLLMDNIPPVRLNISHLKISLSRIAVAMTGSPRKSLIGGDD